MRQAVQCLGVFGRATFVGLTTESLSVFPYPDLINKEAEMIGVSDHLASEIPSLMQFARSGKLRFPPGTIHCVDLDAAQINATLDAMETSTDRIRTVIKS
jgi:threonine dehydrogenase-like Zn-dependent dehydrogenase